MKLGDRYLSLTSAFVLGYFSATFAGTLGAIAQITPDKTLPVNSTVTTLDQVHKIDGGTTRGVNLYHSFQDFSVLTNNTAYFNNAGDIQNIVTRVTGSSISNIDGTLKANGNANLFLLNPNGITFGANANLQIGGSFTASTGSSFKFADGSEFSATNPQAPPLLTTSIPLGVQFGGSQTGATISNQGNLSVGQDLVLHADKLNLQGTLRASGDLNLQGNQSVFVAADSTLFSGRDTIVRSPLRLLENATYTTGGYFMTENLDGSLVNFLNPHQNTIKVDGDITLGDYKGASLYILSSGKVTFGNVEIIQPENNRSITQSIANGQGGSQTITVNSKNDVGILDVRTGIDNQKLLGILEQTPTLPLDVTATFANPSSAAITAGDITNRGGNILLTNQFKPNLSLISQPANITVGGVSTSSFDEKDGGSITIQTNYGDISTLGLFASSFAFDKSVNGGNILLQTGKGNISTTYVLSLVNSNLGTTEHGGAITFQANGGNISTQGLFSSSSANGGAITLLASGDITVTSPISSEAAGIGNGGNIYLHSSNGSIDTTGGAVTAQVTDGSNGTGNGGAITFVAKNDIKTGDVNAGAGSGSSASIHLTSTNGNITTQILYADAYGGDGGEIKLNAYGDIFNQYLISYSFSSSGNGAPITVQSNAGNISSQGVYSLSSAANGGAISLLAFGNITTGSIFSEGAGNGGKIIFSSSNGSIDTTGGTVTAQIADGSNGNGNGGAIAFTAKNDIKTGDLNSGAGSGSGASIHLTSKDGNISTKNLYTDTFGGNGGEIKLNAYGDISTQNLISNSIAYAGASGNGGNISLQTNGNISTQTLESYSLGNTGASGNGGNISLQTNVGNISTQTLESYSLGNAGDSGNGGNISLRSNLGNISTQTLGSYSITGLLLGSDIGGDSGNGGDILVQTNAGNISASEFITTFSNASLGISGNGGNISLRADNGNISAQLIQSLSVSPIRSGNGGNISLTVSKGNISIPYIDSSILGEGGTGGIIQLTGDKLSINNMVINSDGQGGGNGGIIKLNAPLIQINNSDLTTSSYGSGKSGSIELNSTGNITLNNSRLFTTLEPGSTGAGGQIQIRAQNLNLTNFSLINTGTYSIGNAGNITINSENISLTDGSSLQSLTADRGNAGNIFLNIGNDISLSNNSSISTSATQIASGNSGNIQLNSQTLSLLNGSQIQSLTEGIGTSKAGGIIVNVSDRIIIGGVDPNFANPDPNASPQNNPSKQDYNFQSIQDIGTNNSIITAQQLQANDFYIGNPNRNNIDVEYSTRIPFVSLRIMGDDKVHVYAIKVNAGTRAVFDVDNTGSIYTETANQNTITMPVINTKLTLLDRYGKELASNDDASHAFGAEGSVRSMTFQQDPYLKYTFAQGGTYYIQVSNFDGNGVPSTNLTEPINNAQTSFNLQISLAPNPIQANINSQGQPSGIFAYTQGAGNAGNINLNTSILKLESGGSISAFTNGNGNGGTVNINANTLVDLGTGVQNFAPVISVETSGAGKAGDIIINTSNFILSETARITATATKTATNTEQGGSITLNASQMNLAGTVGIFAETQGIAPAGTLNLNPHLSDRNLQVTLAPNSQISASTTGSGKGGSILVTAPEAITVSGKGKLAVETTGIGNAGNISFSTKQLTLTDGVLVSASTSGTGKAGDISIKANNFNLSNGARIQTTTSSFGNSGEIKVIVDDKFSITGNNTGLFANTEITSTGKGGNIFIDPQLVLLQDGATITASSLGSGIGGDVTIFAKNLSLLNNSSIKAETASTNGGNINLNIIDLLLFRFGSQISTTAGTNQSGGNGGNININTGFIVGAKNENSNIFANAFTGNGGNINITTNGIYGLSFSPQPTEFSDITASSQFGLQGNVIVTTPNVDPSRGLTTLPVNLADSSKQVSQGCAVGGKLAGKENSFTISGRGGLPQSPNAELSSSRSLVELTELVPSSTNQVSAIELNREVIKETRKPIVEANAIARNSEGKLRLVATSTLLSPAIPQLACPQ